MTREPSAWEHADRADEARPFALERLRAMSAASTETLINKAGKAGLGVSEVDGHHAAPFMSVLGAEQVVELAAEPLLGRCDLGLRDRNSKGESPEGPATDSPTAPRVAPTP